MTVIYLASPIDQVETVALHAWQQEGPVAEMVVPASTVDWDRWGFYKGQAKAKLVELGYEVYDPAMAWATSREDPEAIQHINDEALNTCEGILGFLPDEIPSIGTPIELAAVAFTGRPAVCLGGDAAMRSPVLASRGVRVEDILSWEEGVKLLNDLILNARMGEDEAKRAGAGYVNEVLVELIRAAKKFPENTPTNTPTKWFGIVVEEYLEVAQAWNDHVRDPQHHGAEAIRTELVQAGAMSARLYDSIRFLD